MKIFRKRLTKFRRHPLDLFSTNRDEKLAFRSEETKQKQRKNPLSFVQSTEQSTSLDEMQDLCADSTEPLDLKLSTLELFDKIKSRHS